AGRTPGAATVDADDDIIVRHPLFRIDHLPALILVGRAGRHVGADFAHPLPLLAVEIVEVQPLAVRAVGHDDRIAALLDRPVDVAAKNDAVVHLDRHVPVDPHPIADFADFAVAHFHFPRRYRFATIVYGATIVVQGRACSTGFAETRCPATGPQKARIHRG